MNKQQRPKQYFHRANELIAYFTPNIQIREQLAELFNRHHMYYYFAQDGGGYWLDAEVAAEAQTCINRAVSALREYDKNAEERLSLNLNHAVRLLKGEVA